MFAGRAMPAAAAHLTPEDVDTPSVRARVYYQARGGLLACRQLRRTHGQGNQGSDRAIGRLKLKGLVLDSATIRAE